MCVCVCVRGGVIYTHREKRMNRGKEKETIGGGCVEREKLESIEHVCCKAREKARETIIGATKSNTLHRKET